MALCLGVGASHCCAMYTLRVFMNQLYKVCMLVLGLCCFPVPPHVVDLLVQFKHEYYKATDYYNLPEY
jgi:hypothetical protein